MTFDTSGIVSYNFAMRYIESNFRTTSYYLITYCSSTFSVSTLILVYFYRTLYNCFTIYRRIYVYPSKSISLPIYLSTLLLTFWTVCPNIFTFIHYFPTTALSLTTSLPVFLTLYLFLYLCTLYKYVSKLLIHNPLIISGQ